MGVVVLSPLRATAAPVLLRADTAHAVDPAPTTPIGAPASLPHETYSPWLSVYDAAVVVYDGASSLRVAAGAARAYDVDLEHTCGSDLDAERGTLMVRQGKGKRDRMVPIGERACAWIRKYVLVLEGGADIRYIQEMLGHAELRRRRSTRRCPSGASRRCTR